MRLQTDTSAAGFFLQIDKSDLAMRLDIGKHSLDLDTFRRPLARQVEILNQACHGILAGATTVVQSHDLLDGEPRFELFDRIADRAECPFLPGRDLAASNGA